MTPRAFAVLLALTGAAVAGAFVVSGERGAGDVMVERGLPLLPGLADASARIAEIRIEGADGAMVLTRRDDGFVDASGYPIVTSAVRDLVTSLATLRIEERKTGDPARLAQLGLADPQASEGGGDRVVLLDSDGGTIAGIIAGARDFTVGGVDGGQFVKNDAREMSHLVRGSVDLPNRRAAWFDTAMFRVPETDLRRLSVQPSSGEPVDLLRSEDGLYLAGPLPAGRVADEVKVERLTRFLEDLDFEDVRAASERLAADNRGGVLVAETETLRLRLERDLSDGEPGIWVRVSVEPLAEGGSETAAEIAARTYAFAFKLNEFGAEIIEWSIADATMDAPAG